MNDIGKEIKKARKSKGLNLTEFAKAAVMDAGAISKLEKNRHCPRVDTLDMLAKALGMELEVRFIEKA